MPKALFHQALFNQSLLKKRMPAQPMPAIGAGEFSIDQAVYRLFSR